MDSFTRFLNKLRELIKGKVKDGDLTAAEFDEAVASARGHVGGTIRWENAREGQATSMLMEFGEGHTGLMVGYWLPEEIAKQLAMDGGEEPDGMHMTLCYCGDSLAMSDLTIAQALVAVESLARRTPPMAGKVSGLGRFNASGTSDGRDVIYASVDMPQLGAFRQQLAETLAMAGCAPRQDHGYTPHITLTYVDQEAATPEISMPDLPLRMDRIIFAVGDKQTELPLTGMPYMEANHMNTWKLFGEMALAEDGKTARIQIFPKVQKYGHPEYGELDVSPEFLQEIKDNFDAKIYGQDLPLTVDLEHQTKLSGPAGWFKDLEIDGDKGMFATIEFNDRGAAVVDGGDGYKYFSPEFYDEWTDPATGKTYSNVLIGGALCARPFFKGMAPVALLSEGGLRFIEAAEGEDDMETMMAQMQAMMDMMSKMGDKMPEGMMAEMEGMMGKMKKQMPKRNAEKTEDGNTYAKSDYLYTPDSMPSHWKLRVAEYVDGKKAVTKAQLGRAAAALGKGFRGEKVELPEGEHAKMVAKLKGMYAKMGVKPEDMPAMMASLTESGLSETEASAVLVEMGLAENKHGGTDMGMTEEEARQFSETQAQLKTLSEKLEAEAEARKLAEADAKMAAERVQSLERAATRKELTEHVRANRLAYQGEVAAAVERLERLATKLGEEDFAVYLAEREAQHTQMKESALFSQTGSTAPVVTGVAAEFEAAKRKLMSETSGLSEADATVRVASENPDLYKRYDTAFKARAKRGE